MCMQLVASCWLLYVQRHTHTKQHQFTKWPASDTLPSCRHLYATCCRAHIIAMLQHDGQHLLTKNTSIQHDYAHARHMFTICALRRVLLKIYPQCPPQPKIELGLAIRSHDEWHQCLRGRPRPGAVPHLVVLRPPCLMMPTSWAHPGWQELWQRPPGSGPKPPALILSCVTSAATQEQQPTASPAPTCFSNGAS